MSSKGKDFQLIEQALRKADAIVFLAQFQDQDIRDDGVDDLLHNPKQLASVIDTIGARNRFANEWKKISTCAPSHINQQRKLNELDDIDNGRVYLHHDEYRNDHVGYVGGGHSGHRGDVHGGHTNRYDGYRGGSHVGGGYRGGGGHKRLGYTDEYDGYRGSDYGSRRSGSSYGDDDRRGAFKRHLQEDNHGKAGGDRGGRSRSRDRGRNNEYGGKDHSRRESRNVYPRGGRRDDYVDRSGYYIDKYDKYDNYDRDNKSEYGRDRDIRDDRDLDNKNRSGGVINEHGHSNTASGTPIQNQIYNANDTTNNGISMGVGNTNNNINNNINNTTITYLEGLHLNEKTPNQQLSIRLRLLYRSDGGHIKSSKDLYRHGVCGSIKNIVNKMCHRIQPQNQINIIHGVLNEYNDKLSEFKDVLDLDNVIFSEELAYLKSNPQYIYIDQLLFLLIMTTHIGEKKQILMRLKQYTMNTIKHIHENDFEVLDEIYNNEGDLKQFLQLIDDAMVKIGKWFNMQIQFNLRMQYIQYINRLRLEIQNKVCGNFYECYSFYTCKLCGNEIQKLKRNISIKQLMLLIDHKEEKEHQEHVGYSQFEDNNSRQSDRESIEF